MFNEITKNAIQKSVREAPGRESCTWWTPDRPGASRPLVGYKISPLLWDKVRRGFPRPRADRRAAADCRPRARNQGVHHRGILEHRRPPGGQEAPQLTAHLAKKNDENVEIPNEASAQAIVAAVDGVDYVVRSVVNKEKRRNPVPPFITRLCSRKPRANFALA
jgi:DNA topoisomerase-1